MAADEARKETGQLARCLAKEFGFYSTARVSCKLSVSQCALRKGRKRLGVTHPPRETHQHGAAQALRASAAENPPTLSNALSAGCVLPAPTPPFLLRG